MGILEIGKGYEKALMEGRLDDLGEFFADDIEYVVTGQPPIGGVFKGKDAVINSFKNREFGLGPGFEYGSREVNWMKDEDNEVIFVEIHEKTWLKNDPEDVLDIWTLSVIKIKDGKITHIRDYTDSEAYFKFAGRHKELGR